MAWFATNMRGPGITPALIALRNPNEIQSDEPRSRTVVTPASSVTLA
jgi:hypothetical protein